MNNNSLSTKSRRVACGHDWREGPTYGPPPPPRAWLCSSQTTRPSPLCDSLTRPCCHLERSVILHPTTPPRTDVPFASRPHHRLLSSIASFHPSTTPSIFTPFCPRKFSLLVLPRGDLVRSRSCSPDLPMASQGDFSTAMANRSLRNIRSVRHLIRLSLLCFHTDPETTCRSWSFLQTLLSSRRSSFRPSYLNCRSQQKDARLFLSPRPPCKHQSQCNHQSRRRPTNLPQPSSPILPSARRLQSSHSTRLQSRPRRMLKHPRFCRLHRHCMPTLQLMLGTSPCSPRIVFKFSST